VPQPLADRTRIDKVWVGVVVLFMGGDFKGRWGR